MEASSWPCDCRWSEHRSHADVLLGLKLYCETSESSLELLEEPHVVVLHFLLGPLPTEIITNTRLFSHSLINKRKSDADLMHKTLPLVSSRTNHPSEGSDLINPVRLTRLVAQLVLMLGPDRQHL